MSRMFGVSVRRLRKVAIILACAVAVSRCASQPAATSVPTAPAMTPVLTVQELMEHIIDPQADYVFNAVAYDVGPQGAVETKPTTDEDWTRIERGAWVLAESASLLKISRSMAPAHVTRPGGPGAPELSPLEIEAKVKADPKLWLSHADALQAEALKVIDIVKARDADKLFAAGTALDTACEGCHLDFWYPGDRAAVEKSRTSSSYTIPPKK